MSAFLCNKETFEKVYSGLIVYGESRQAEYLRNAVRYATLPHQYEEGGGCISYVRALYAANVEAVGQRYNDETRNEPGAKRIPFTVGFDPHVDLYAWIKALECLLYQMSEGDVPESDTYKSLKSIINASYKEAVHMHDRYEAAEWC